MTDCTFRKIKQRFVYGKVISVSVLNSKCRVFLIATVREKCVFPLITTTSVRLVFLRLNIFLFILLFTLEIVELSLNACTPFSLKKHYLIGRIYIAYICKQRNCNRGIPRKHGIFNRLIEKVRLLVQIFLCCSYKFCVLVVCKVSYC